MKIKQKEEAPSIQPTTVHQPLSVSANLDNSAAFCSKCLFLTISYWMMVDGQQGCCKVMASKHPVAVGAVGQSRSESEPTSHVPWR